MPHISTGYKKFDVLLGGGLKRKSLTLLAGATGLGKTTLALNITANIALAKKPQTVLYFSNDECHHTLTENLIAATAKVSVAVVKRSAFAFNKELAWTATKISASPLFIEGGKWNSCNLSTMIGIAKSNIFPGHFNKHMDAPSLIIIDHIRCVADHARKYRNSREHLRVVLGKLKELAIDLNATVVAIVPIHHRQGKVCEAQPRELENLFGKDKFSDEQLFMRGELTPLEHNIELHAAVHKGKAVLSYNPELALFSEKSSATVPIQGDLRNI
ncbi:MAG: DnaB helicase C-terminal domain-containing protein [Elusimicrobia bacterium]|nr:DnaB helicase C-terminal domain-containing protein [Candidatus Omnitrophota bacterium]MCG2726597.1 DnaB helicase C-terminal domain-containing protein [Elusimicrobiota bacterium]